MVQCEPRASGLGGPLLFHLSPRPPTSRVPALAPPLDPLTREKKANQEVHWFSPHALAYFTCLLKAHVPQMASCTPGIRPEILRGLKDGVGRWLLIGCSCVASRVHTNPTTWRSLLPTWPRPFLAQPITSPAPRTPLVGQRERERGRIESCLDLLLPQSHSHWQTSGPHSHWGPSVVVDAPRDEVSLAPDTRLMAGALRERVKWFALSSPCPHSLSVMGTQEFSVECSVLYSKLPFH